ncbi:MAG: HNH endonuclease [Deltaproteobacteria bacterium]|nr:HNH endonuclease [Deltaproteobacteria bacterium]
MGDLKALQGLSDRELLGGLKAAVGRSRRADVEVIRFIAEVDARKLYREQACSSMFGYCRERLGMSEPTAVRRIRVARLARQVPQVLSALESGRVHLAGLALLAPHIDAENVDEVLARAAGLSKRAIEALVAELAPKPAVRTTIRRVARARSVDDHLAGARRSTGSQMPESAPSPGNVSPPRPAAVKPLAPARYHVSFTASEALKQNLERARELAGHGATVEGLIEDAVELLVAELEKNKLGVAGRKPGRVANPRGRYIAKAIKREVFERDGGQCTFMDESGRRCSERNGLHFDHVVPHARGGASTTSNLRLRCGPHNQLHAEDCFGPLFVEQCRRRSPREERG